MTEQILIYVIVALFGVILGGAGGQAIVRRAVGNVSNGNGHSGDVAAAATAATAAASAAATAAAALNGHVASLQHAVENQSALLTDIALKQTHLATVFEQFPTTCKLRHDNIEKEQGRMQAEIDTLRKQ